MKMDEGMKMIVGACMMEQDSSDKLEQEVMCSGATRGTEACSRQLKTVVSMNIGEKQEEATLQQTKVKTVSMRRVDKTKDIRLHSVQKVYEGSGT